jgi:hypothetical protein
MAGEGSPKRSLEHSEEEPSGYSPDTPLITLNRGAIEKVIEREVKKARTKDNYESQLMSLSAP